jgi:hypothetical protein
MSCLEPWTRHVEACAPSSCGGHQYTTRLSAVSTEAQSLVNEIFRKLSASQPSRRRWQPPLSAPPGTTRRPPCRSTDGTASCGSRRHKPRAAGGGRGCRWRRRPAGLGRRTPSRRPRTPSSSRPPTPGPSCSSTVRTEDLAPFPSNDPPLGLENLQSASLCAGVCNLCNGGVRFVREHDPNRYSLPAPFPHLV